jgi:hypothetical protein
MKIVIKIIYKVYGIKSMQCGAFPLNPKKFKEDPDQEAARVAFNWLKEIKREMNVEEIVEVVYDGDQDITGSVKEFEQGPPR